MEYVRKTFTTLGYHLFYTLFHPKFWAAVLLVLTVTYTQNTTVCRSRERFQRRCEHRYLVVYLFRLSFYYRDLYLAAFGFFGSSF